MPASTFTVTPPSSRHHNGPRRSTPCQYVNGVPIRDSKRTVIEAAITALSYNRNAAASARRTDRNNLVALLVPGHGEFFGSVTHSLNARLVAHG